MPDPLPVDGRGIGTEEDNALLEQAGRSVLWGELQALLKLPLSAIPVTLAISRQATGEQVTQCERV
jgi:hypothetical protein